MLLISNTCFIILIKAANSLINYIDDLKMKIFLQLWYNLDNYIKELFLLLSQLGLNDNTSLVLTSAVKEKALKAILVLKKAKSLDDLDMAIETQITILQN